MFRIENILRSQDEITMLQFRRNFFREVVKRILPLAPKGSVEASIAEKTDGDELDIQRVIDYFFGGLDVMSRDVVHT